MEMFGNFVTWLIANAQIIGIIVAILIATKADGRIDHRYDAVSSVEPV